MTIQKYDHRLIEGKWQEKWANDRIYSPHSMMDVKNPYYNLWMFPYPSAEGVHVGTIFSSTGSDVFGRYKRMKGFTVFQPFGYDSFGIHSENYAMKVGKTPQNMLEHTITHYESQFKMVGHGYDWNRTVTTSNEDYYHWTQWLFITLFKAGLAYRKKQAVNWCPGCKTVLADEQIMTPSQAGKVPPGYSSVEEVPEGIKVCERCGNIPEIKDLEQWFFRITDYADKLLEGQKKIDWSERVAVAQRNWIGKSEGVYVTFPFVESDLSLQIYTTAIETIFGVTFMVVSPDHPILESLSVPEEYKTKLDNYIKTHKNTSKTQDTQKSKEKTGVFTGCFVKHPFKDVNIPVWVSDYVVMDYGTGAIMAVPAHDARDREFAQNFDLPIVPVVKPKKEEYSDIVEGDGFWDYSEIKSQYSDDSILFDSESFSGLSSSDAKVKLTQRIEEEGRGHAKSHFHLRDWLISRQRYWGPPIPMIYCEACAQAGKSWFDTEKNSLNLLHEDQSDWTSAGWFPEESLPVTLPIIEDYKPKGEGRGPLADHQEFYEVPCPSCGSPAKRETDVSDTFLDSSWYFLRYPSVGSERKSETRYRAEASFSAFNETKVSFLSFI
jgi:leucyl-tRNA synthetase